jgi:glucokinase
LRCADYPSLRAAAQAYLDAVPARMPDLPAVRHAAIAIATPVEGDAVAMTNHHWSFSIESFKRELNLLALEVVNDFTALAMSLPYLAPHQRVQVGGGSPRPGAPVGLVGPGTGLGVSGLVHARSGWTALASEGGHVSFAPNSDLEVSLLHAMRREWPHASAERLLSGAGLEFIHRVVSGGRARTAPDITRLALDGACGDCLLTVDTFCAMLGSVAGNVALTLGATGGIYIGGGIVPRIAALLERSPFRARFEAKGRLSTYLARIPTYWIAEPYPAFFGVSAVLSDRTV